VTERAILAAGQGQTPDNIPGRFCALATLYETALRAARDTEVDAYKQPDTVRLRTAVAGLLEDLRQLSYQAVGSLHQAAERTRRATSLSANREEWLLQDVLPALDTYFRAEESREKLQNGLTAEELKDPLFRSWLGLYERTRPQVEAFLAAIPLRRLTPRRGLRLDPRYHEVLTTIRATDVASGHIVLTKSDGYSRGDEVFRKAIVVAAE
jgi:molecular chaperone GrpE (heat shock protein)